MQPIRISMGLFSRLMRCAMLTAMTPTMVEMAVVISVGIKMSVGWAAPICERYIMMLTGDKYQSRGVEDKEHYHRIGGSILFRV